MISLCSPSQSSHKDHFCLPSVKHQAALLPSRFLAGDLGSYIMQKMVASRCPGLPATKPQTSLYPSTLSSVPYPLQGQVLHLCTDLQPLPLQDLPLVPSLLVSSTSPGPGTQHSSSYFPISFRHSSTAWHAWLGQ